MTKETTSAGPNGRQTGVHGEHSSPFVVSFGAAGFHHNGPDLRGPITALRTRLASLKASHQREGWLDWDQWVLLRATPDGRQQHWAYMDGVIDDRRWEESVDGVPACFDSVLLSSGHWGQLHLASPSHVYLGARIRSLTAWVECPRAGVEATSAAFVEQLMVTADVQGVLTGFVHVDSTADPYTEVVTAPSRLSADRFDVEVHGYYWAVLLTDEHLERLGGMSRTRREAPCARVEPLRVKGGQGLLCVLTDSPLDIGAEAMLSWREFLLPVLRAGYPSGWEDIAEVGTPLHRPLWLFEGAPAPRLIRLVLEKRDSIGAHLTVDWLDRREDPAWLTCLLYPGRQFDRELHPSAVAAVVNAWFVTGLHGRLLNVEGVLNRVTAPTYQADDRGDQALVWGVDPGTCEPSALIDRLAAALSELGGVLGRDVFDRLRIA